MHRRGIARKRPPERSLKAANRGACRLDSTPLVSSASLLLGWHCLLQIYRHYKQTNEIQRCRLLTRDCTHRPSANDSNFLNLVGPRLSPTPDTDMLIVKKRNVLGGLVEVVESLLCTSTFKNASDSQGLPGAEGNRYHLRLVEQPRTAVQSRLCMSTASTQDT